MAFLQRFADRLWGYVSPVKATRNGLPTPPETESPRRFSLANSLQRQPSMSPVERVRKWNSTTQVSTGKRKSSSTSQDPSRRLKKQPRLDGVVTDMTDDSPMQGAQYESGGSDGVEEVHDGGEEAQVDEYDGEVDQDYLDEASDEELDEKGDQYRLANDFDDISSSMSSFHVWRRAKGYLYPASDGEEDSTTVITAEQDYYYSPASLRKRHAAAAARIADGIPVNHLRDQGWPESHIFLVQRLSLRGFEPILPAVFRSPYSFLPESLFSESDSALISSTDPARHHAAELYLNKLLHLPARVRSRLQAVETDPPDLGRRPETITKNILRDYMKWAGRDSGLSRFHTIPLVAIEVQPADTPAEILNRNAKRKLDKLAARWAAALAVTPSIEANETSSTTSSQASLLCPLPTLYTFVASHNIVGLAAYDPSKGEEADLITVAMFDLRDVDYDVWNALAFAAVICHCRNMQGIIAQETGVGLPDDEDASYVSPDPDL